MSKPTIEEITTAARVIKYLIGYVENASDTSLHVSQDDATKGYVVRLGADSLHSRADSFYEDRLGVALLAAVNSVDESER